MTHDFGGAWTEEKLLVMKSYFGTYAKALSGQPFARWYVDAFAGTGERLHSNSSTSDIISLFGEEAQEVGQIKDGSVRLALNIEPSFTRYIFIDQSIAHTDKLRDLKAEFPSRNIEIHQADANKELIKLAKNTNWQNTRAAIFIDPYGMQVDWNTLEILAATKSCDIALLFPTGSINRMLARSAEIPVEWFNRIDRHLGECDWRAAAYAETQVYDLFSQPTTKSKKSITADGLKKFVYGRLKEIFPFVYPNPYELRNSKDSVLYHLFIMSANPSPKAIGLATRIAGSAFNQPKKHGT